MPETLRSSSLLDIPFELQYEIVKLSLTFNEPLRIHGWLYTNTTNPSQTVNENVNMHRTSYVKELKSHLAITQTCHQYRALSSLYYAQNIFAFPEDAIQDDQATILRFIRNAGLSNLRSVSSIAIPARAWKIYPLVTSAFRNLRNLKMVLNLSTTKVRVVDDAWEWQLKFLCVDFPKLRNIDGVSSLDEKWRFFQPLPNHALPHELEDFPFNSILDCKYLPFP